MKKMNIGMFICFGGILTTIAILFQSAPVFLPAIGLALSPFSTLPIAIAAVSNISLGFAVFFSSALILVIVSTKEAIILLFTTGLLGIVIGSFLYRKGIAISILFSSIALSLGMVFLTYIVGIPAFAELSNSLSTPLIIIIFLSFSLVYASIWSIGLRKFIRYLIKI
ncbi:hypothetical protein [Lachnoclostridium phytofermentans]|uniref:hypothetical protein n=1 Tax=Lachnoclostridium phytofermentans TaxID=66219 RepID=UPI0002DD2E48|nr:hypothetical protein [Lachnoclostridium phytofermentans]